MRHHRKGMGLALVQNHGRSLHQVIDGGRVQALLQLLPQDFAQIGLRRKGARQNFLHRRHGLQTGIKGRREGLHIGSPPRALPGNRLDPRDMVLDPVLHLLQQEPPILGLALRRRGKFARLPRLFLPRGNRQRRRGGKQDRHQPHQQTAQMPVPGHRPLLPEVEPPGPAQHIHPSRQIRSPVADHGIRMDGQIGHCLIRDPHPRLRTMRARQGGPDQITPPERRIDKACLRRQAPARPGRPPAIGQIDQESRLPVDLRFLHQHDRAAHLRLTRRQRAIHRRPADRLDIHVIAKRVHVARVVRLQQHDRHAPGLIRLRPDLDIHAILRGNLGPRPGALIRGKGPRETHTLHPGQIPDDIDRLDEAQEFVTGHLAP